MIRSKCTACHLFFLTSKVKGLEEVGDMILGVLEIRVHARINAVHRADFGWGLGDGSNNSW